MTYFHEPPTVEQIARGLSTVPRWNGRTILDRVGHRWSVLQHTLVGMAVAAQGESPEVQVYFAFHDAEECVAGDTPKPYKTEEQSVQGDTIRDEILKAVGLPGARSGVLDAVKQIDEWVRCAEACTLLAPHEFLANPGYVSGFVTDVGEQVWGLIDIPPRTAIDLFVDKVHDLMQDKQVRALRRLA